MPRFVFVAAAILALNVSQSSLGAVAAVANGQLQLHFIDGGQADAAVIIGPQGQVVLVDPGAEAMARLHAAKVRTFWTSVGNGVMPLPGLGTVAGGVVFEVAPGAATFDVRHGGTVEAFPVSEATLAPPDPPTDLVGTVVGSTVNLSWTPPTSGTPPTSYLVEASMTAGGPVIASLPLTLSSVSVPGVPNGTYFVRVRAVNAEGVSGLSNETIVTVGVAGCDSAPGTPTGLAGSVNGSAVALAWTPSTTGCAATGFVVRAGSAPNLTNLVSLPVGNVTGLNVSAPVGRYFVTVTAQNAFGTSGSSNEIVVAIGASCTIPGPPTAFAVGRTGSIVSMSWAPPATGGAPAGYLLEAGSGPGLANLAVLPLAGLSFSTSPPPGTYYLRVKARNACGLGPASTEQALTTTCIALGPTGAPSASVAGTTATISWGGVAGATSYRLAVGTAVGASNVLLTDLAGTTRQLSGLAAGTYFMRVTTFNSCGAGTVSGEGMFAVAASTPEPTWLTQVNAWRARGGLAPVTENPSFSSGDVLHARYSTKHDVLMHDENPSSPWYSPEGRAAAMASNGAGNGSATAPDSFAIESWVQAPFHAIGMLAPSLLTTGYGSFREAGGSIRMSGWLDVIRGQGTPPSIPVPVAFPADGATIPIPNANICPTGTACFWGEVPSPLTSCPGYITPAGLPLILQFPGNSKPVVTGSSLLRAGATPLEHCVFTGSTYLNPDSAAQQTGRSILSSRGGVVLVPRFPLQAASTYTVSITASGQTYQWSFTIAPPQLSDGPLPSWALTALPPSFAAPRRVQLLAR